jgi:hypothetical protein
VKTKSLEINQVFSIEELAQAGLRQRDIKELEAKIFVKEDKVYFFDKTDHKHYRLYSVIHKRSFFL